MSRILLSLVLLATSTSSVAWGVPVKGILKLPADTPAVIVKAPGFWLLPNDVLNVLPPLVDLRASMVVAIEGASPSTTTPPKPVLRLEDMRFNPPLLAVRPNTKVTFENKDATLHLIEPIEGTFMSAKRVDAGSVNDHTFDKAGAYRLRCSEYPHMSATVLVLDAPLFVLPDNSGAFTFPDVRPGSYKLKVWYQGDWIHSQSLTVKARTTIEVQLERLTAGKS
jgi:plastocyanin